MKRLAFLAALATFLFSATTASASAVAPFGSVLTTFTPTHLGEQSNGRAIAVDPHSGTIYYTFTGDNRIYLTDASGAFLGTLTTTHNYGALSWDSKRDVLWGGRYDGSGAVDQIDPSTGASAPQFAYAFPAGDSCVNGNATGFIDGLGYDRVADNLWLSDDDARTVFHVTLTGATLNSFTVPDGKCNTGIAVTGQFLWLARLTGAGAPPFDIVRVAKSNPTTVIASIKFTSQAGFGGPEGIAVDKHSFVPNCTVWTNQFGSPQLTAWAVEPGCPANT
jgi:hypothetical protein